MAKDPAFLYYDGDAAKDMAHMNRLERGAYIDLVHAQKKFGRMSIEIIKKILGKDFDLCWSAIEVILSIEEEKYFIEWVELSITKRANFTESRRKNRSKGDNSNIRLYLMLNGKNGHVKIGSSNNPERRLLEVRNELKNENIKLVWISQNTTQKEEAALHKKFARKNVFNEWFNLSNEDLKTIFDAHPNHMIDHMYAHMINHMEIENEIENINVDEKVDDGAEEGVNTYLIPEMLKCWKKHKPLYPEEKDNDFPALMALSEFICNQSKTPYNPRDGCCMGLILTQWEKWAVFVCNDDFYTDFSLASIKKNSQTIYQKMQNGAKRKTNQQDQQPRGAVITGDKSYGRL